MWTKRYTENKIIVTPDSEQDVYEVAKEVVRTFNHQLAYEKVEGYFQGINFPVKITIERIKS